MTIDDAVSVQTDIKTKTHVGVTFVDALLVALLIWLADWLFYGHDIGISLTIFLSAITAAAFAARRPNLTRRQFIVALSVLLIGLIPTAVQPGLLATIFGFIATAYLAASMSGVERHWTERIADSMRLLRDITWRAPVELNENIRLRARRPRWSMFIGWIVPLGFCAAFVVLLSSANPLIEALVPHIDVGDIFAYIDVPRLLLWVLFACLVWPFVFERIRPAAEGKEWSTYSLSPAAPLQSLPHGLLDNTAILRSLVLFNALFAVESVLDLIYLWGGVALPNSMSYASYAHRGAYPLIATALLAAAFVLIAFRPGATASQPRIIKALLFAFVGQNIFLVLSSILRLDLYVEVYSLTYWRLAAGIWMGLVAIGLVLIVVRIVKNRSNTWLIGANAIALTATLYAASLINLPALIADYNVAHSRQISGQGQPLDIGYLQYLGPHTIPALDRFFAKEMNANSSIYREHTRPAFRAAHLARMTDWRAWSVFDAALGRYLEDNPVAPVVGQPD